MYPSISAEELAKKTAEHKVPILDVRGESMYREGHVPGAINLPLEELPDSLEQLEKDTTYYVICRTGNRSAQASEYLSEKGFHVVNIQDGTLAWPGKLEKE